MTLSIPMELPILSAFYRATSSIYNYIRQRPVIKIMDASGMMGIYYGKGPMNTNEYLFVTHLRVTNIGQKDGSLILPPILKVQLDSGEWVSVSLNQEVSEDDFDFHKGIKTVKSFQPIEGSVSHIMYEQPLIKDGRVMGVIIIKDGIGHEEVRELSFSILNDHINDHSKRMKQIIKEHPNISFKDACYIIEQQKKEEILNRDKLKP